MWAPYSIGLLSAFNEINDVVFVYAHTIFESHLAALVLEHVRCHTESSFEVENGRMLNAQCSLQMDYEFWMSRNIVLVEKMCIFLCDFFVVNGVNLFHANADRSIGCK